jgi:hypothetical protein
MSPAAFNIKKDGVKRAFELTGSLVSFYRKFKTFMLTAIIL